MNEDKRYNSIDGLRMIAAFGIILAHVRANSNYNIDGFLYNKVVYSFVDFIYLFFTISAFSMCCGYYDKMLNNNISLEKFYSRRFKRIFPFFSIIVIIDLLASPSVGSLYEAFADMTLLFGFLPDYNKISVVGVGWFLGLIFVFYLIFPFFCTLLVSKRRAWMAFAVSLVYHFVCLNYFHADRYSILYSGCFFILGGILYLYREKISRVKGWIAAVVVVVGTVGYYIVMTYMNTPEIKNTCCLLVSMALLVFAMVCHGGILENKVTAFFGKISFELYLSHMFIFGIIEKMGLLYVFGHGWFQFLFTVLIVIAGATLFSVVARKGIEVVEEKISDR